MRKLTVFFSLLLLFTYPALCEDLRICNVLFQKDLNIDVTGTVRDQVGAVLPGVAVNLEGNNRIGTTTDLNGRFVLSVPEDAVLVFQMIGFVEQKMRVGKERDDINITLSPVTSRMDEVVVVAFGNQKKEDMVGAVVSVNPSDLRIPASNLTTALAGKVPGMIAFQRSGEPGEDNAQFFIRGVSTFGVGKKDPLILVDGIETSVTDFAALRPSDIESFSVLKDATSTAVYGSRAANGIILVKTKSGTEGRLSVSLRSELSVSKPTTNLKFADPVTYMKLYNDAQLTRNPFTFATYSNQKIIGTERGGNPNIFPATDWKSELFKDYTLNPRIYLNVHGGGKIAQYFVSGSLYQDNGLLNVDKRNNFNSNINLKKYSLRANVDVNLTRTTKLTVRLNGNFDDYVGPVNSAASLYNKVVHTSPVDFPAYYQPDSAHSRIRHILFGGLLDRSFQNPYADLISGFKNYNRSLIQAQLDLKQDLAFITQGLSLSFMMNNQRFSRFEVVRSYNPFYYYLSRFDLATGEYGLQGINPETGSETLDYSVQGRLQEAQFYFQSMIDYNRTFNDKHNVSGMLVNLIQSSQSTSGNSLLLSLPHRNVGLSGRFSYSYDKRYYAEIDFGYNGSERFSQKKRFGFFPSYGIAWSVSNESFWKPLKDVVNNFRTRLTYGKIGNDQIGSATDRFFFMSSVNMNNDSKHSIFGRRFNNIKPGISIDRYANDEIGWEVSKKINLGIELGFLNALELTVDLYKERRSNILMSNITPSFVGLTSNPVANVGKMKSEGIDLSLDYQKFFSNGIWLKLMGNFTYATNEYLIYEEPVVPSAPWLQHVGYSVSQPRGLIAERVFVDERDISNSPSQDFGTLLVPGDLKYLDINNDGRINDLDVVPMGFPTDPEIVYGFGISFGINQFDFSTFFQGLARESFWIDARNVSPFVGNNQLLEAFVEDRFSVHNPNLYPIVPRFDINHNGNNERNSNWWLRNGSFLRLKQAEIGYSIPQRIIKRIHINTLRFYVNGSNLILFSPFKLWDVEMGGNGLGYPLQRVFNFGLNVQF